MTQRSPATDLALISVGAALIAALALAPAIPLGATGVPITLQTLGVLLVGAVFGAGRGALAAALYLGVGLAGMPIFAGGTGGVALLADPSAGYALSFPLVAWVAGTLVDLVFRGKQRLGRLLPLTLFGTIAVAAIVVGHPAGIAVMAWRTGMPLPHAALVDLAFVPGDLLKAAVAASVTLVVYRAFPTLARQPRRRPVDGRATGPAN